MKVMPDEQKQRVLEVVEIATGEVVKSIPVSGGERRIEKVTMGLLRNMDTDRFFVRDTGDAKNET